MRPWGDINQEHIDNEIRVAVKLCEPGTHKNIVSVFELGQIPRSAYYFMDMERCDLNLNDYIKRKWTPRIREKVPEFIDPSPEAEKAQLYDIIINILNGVAFIHEYGEVHRDLKPHNGIRSCQ
jgi:serine/threonine protein kinase